MARTRDPNVDDAITMSTLALLEEQGFGAMTVEAVAERAGVGKPAIYRRFAGKAALVAAVIAQQLPNLVVPDVGDTRAELWEAMAKGLPPDGSSYVRLIGGLIAEEQRHPELIEAFRTKLLFPRRTVVISLIERGQCRGDIRADLDPEFVLDSMAGAFLARAFAGLGIGLSWRKRAFESWWTSMTERSEDD
jgi:AcrR family transcriptional regulator